MRWSIPFGLLQLHDVQVGAVDPDPDAPPLPGGAADVVRFFMDVPQWIQIAGVVLGGVSVVVVAGLAWRHRRQIHSRVHRLPTVVKATALAVVAAGGAVAAVGGYQVYDFVEHDNRFCTGCHVMAEAYVRFEESPHAELGCKACHAQPKTESARQLYLWVLERPHEVGPHSPVPDARCTTCHVDEDPLEWPQISASLGHRVHLESADPELGDIMCVTCHGVSVHEFTPAEATCGGCHESEATVRLGRMAAETELHCVACHDFLSDEPTELPGAAEGMALLPDRAQCQACHGMSGLLAEQELDADPHGAVCGACHNPHAQDSPQGAVESCTGCHMGSDTLTIFHTGTHAEIHAQCTACHSAHGWSVVGADCQSCHNVLEGAPSRASQGAGGADAGTSNGVNPAAAAQHGERSVPRESSGGGGWDMEDGGSGDAAWGARGWAQLAHRSDEVASAIRDESAVAGRVASPVVADTLLQRESRPFRHGQHEVVQCTRCHGTAQAHGVVTVRTAEECAACHHAPAQPYSCNDCHASSRLQGVLPVDASMTLTVWDAPRSRTLPFDHELHQGLVCQECHTGPVMMAVEGTCARCHEEHHRPAAECARCHVPAEPGVHGLEVHLTCSSAGCHADAAGERPTLGRTLCLACHADQRDHEPGLECQTCHMIPDPPPVRSGFAPSSIDGEGASA